MSYSTQSIYFDFFTTINDYQFTVIDVPYNAIVVFNLCLDF